MEEGSKEGEWKGEEGVMEGEEKWEGKIKGKA